MGTCCSTTESSNQSCDAAQRRRRTSRSTISRTASANRMRRRSRSRISRDAANNEQLTGITPNVDGEESSDPVNPLTAPGSHVGREKPDASMTFSVAALKQQGDREEELRHDASVSPTPPPEGGSVVELRAVDRRLQQNAPRSSTSTDITDAASKAASRSESSSVPSVNLMCHAGHGSVAGGLDDDSTKRSWPTSATAATTSDTSGSATAFPAHHTDAFGSSAGGRSVVAPSGEASSTSDSGSGGHKAVQHNRKRSETSATTDSSLGRPGHQSFSFDKSPSWPLPGSGPARLTSGHAVKHAAVTRSFISHTDVSLVSMCKQRLQETGYLDTLCNANLTWQQQRIGMGMLDCVAVIRAVDLAVKREAFDVHSNNSTASGESPHNGEASRSVGSVENTAAHIASHADLAALALSLLRTAVIEGAHIAAAESCQQSITTRALEGGFALLRNSMERFDGLKPLLAHQNSGVASILPGLLNSTSLTARSIFDSNATALVCHSRELVMFQSRRPQRTADDGATIQFHNFRVCNEPLRCGLPGTDITLSVGSGLHTGALATVEIIETDKSPLVAPRRQRLTMLAFEFPDASDNHCGELFGLMHCLPFALAFLHDFHMVRGERVMLSSSGERVGPTADAQAAVLAAYLSTEWRQLLLRTTSCTTAVMAVESFAASMESSLQDASSKLSTSDPSLMSKGTSWCDRVLPLINGLQFEVLIQCWSHSSFEHPWSRAAGGESSSSSIVAGPGPHVLASPDGALSGLIPFPTVRSPSSCQANPQHDAIDGTSDILDVASNSSGPLQTAIRDMLPHNRSPPEATGIVSPPEATNSTLVELAEASLNLIPLALGLVMVHLNSCNSTTGEAANQKRFVGNIAFGLLRYFSPWVVKKHAPASQEASWSLLPIDCNSVLSH